MSSLIASIKRLSTERTTFTRKADAQKGATPAEVAPDVFQVPATITVHKRTVAATPEALARAMVLCSRAAVSLTPAAMDHANAQHGKVYASTHAGMLELASWAKSEGLTAQVDVEAALVNAATTVLQAIPDSLAKHDMAARARLVAAGQTLHLAHHVAAQVCTVMGTADAQLAARAAAQQAAEQAKREAAKREREAAKSKLSGALAGAGILSRKAGAAAQAA